MESEAPVNENGSILSVRRCVSLITSGISILFVSIAILAVWTLHAHPLPIDFLSYWAASKLVLTGQASAAYDLHQHHAVEMIAAPIHGLLPFTYPPPYLFIIAPLALAPYWLSFALWLTITVTVYLLALTGKWRTSLAMSHPSVLANCLIGQNGFLTTSIFAAGLSIFAKRPFKGGLMLGLIVIKPQLALALPFALMAGRQWRVAAGALLSGSSVLLMAFVVFGANVYTRFYPALQMMAQGVKLNLWRWNELASVFAALRYLGVPQWAALGGQIIIGSAVIALMCRAWWRDLEEREALLAAASVLVSPYIFTYDALLLVLPMSWLLERGRHLHLIAVSWLFCLLPVAGYFGVYNGPNTVPLAALICIWALHRSGSPGTQLVFTDPIKRVRKESSNFFKFWPSSVRGPLFRLRVNGFTGLPSRVTSKWT